MSDIVQFAIEIDTTASDAALKDWLRSIPGAKKATEIKTVTLEMGDYYDADEVTRVLSRCPYGAVLQAQVIPENAVGLTEKGLEEIAGEPSDNDLTDEEKNKITEDLTGRKIPSESGATISINGGPKVDPLSEEGQKILAEARDKMVEAQKNGEEIMVSINDGEEYPFGSPELEQALKDLCTPKEEGSAQNKPQSEEGGAADTGTEGDGAEPQAQTKDSDASPAGSDETQSYTSDPTLPPEQMVFKNNEHAGALQFARQLHGRQYREELTDEEEKVFVNGGYVVVFGASDDLTEFRGVVHDELDSYDGGHFVFDDKEKAFVHLDDVIESIEKEEGEYTEIKAEWSPEDSDLSWAFHTNIEAVGRFTIKEDDGVYGEGLVFHVSELKPFNK